MIRRHTLDPRPRCGALGSALLLAALGTALAPAPPAHAQLRPAEPLQEAYFAWDEGRYVDAMEGYLEVLEGPGGERHVREAAILTGELHPVREVDDDGRGLAVSPDGAYLSWAREGPDGWRTWVEPAGGGERVELPGRVTALSAGGRAAYVEDGELRIVELDTGRETAAPGGGLRAVDLRFAPDREVLFLAAGSEETGEEVRIHRARVPEWRLEPLETGVPVAVDPLPVAGGRALLFGVPEDSPLAEPGEEGIETGGPRVGLMDLETGDVVLLEEGGSPSVARDGSFFAFHRSGGEGEPHRILGAPLGDRLPASADDLRLLVETDRPTGEPAVSPDGSTLAFQHMPHRNWEVFLVPTDGSAERTPGVLADPAPGVRRLTRETQHDQFPAWVDEERLVAMKGEFRHRRSYLYDVDTGEGYRLFHNNTLRTIAPEYEWVVAPDARGVLISAERDGNTIAPERGVFRVDLTREVGREELVRRLRGNLEAERSLLSRGGEAFAPVAEEVAAAAGEVSVGRIFHYADALYRMGSKFVTQPGNAPAIEYLKETLESWGYEVELQWFEPRGIPSANVVATLPGTTNPELVYVISSHFDSVLRSPGADDNSSGTTALLEAARVLRDHPRRATIQFAFLTAEEAGLLGAREFVRRAEAEGKRVAGVLNNDMIGWTRSHRLDNTIRYSNAGIKDLQHAAAHLFSDLITYDALYYRFTDAAVFYDAYGDIVGGIGSYPVLGNPNYHQATDELVTIDQRLVAAVSRTTVATIMLLADSPSRLTGLRVEDRRRDRIRIAWDPSPEAGVTGYRVQTVGPDGRVEEVGVVDGPGAEVRSPAPGTVVRVRALAEHGSEGWDWAALPLD